MLSRQATQRLLPSVLISQRLAPQTFPSKPLRRGLLCLLQDVDSVRFNSVQFRYFSSSSSYGDKDHDELKVEVTKTEPQADWETKDVIKQLVELQRELKRSLEKGGAGTFSTTLPDEDENGVRRLEGASEIRDALTVAEDILKKTEVVFPLTSPHPALARAYNDYGFVLKSRGDFHRSVEAYHKSIQLYEESLGRRSKGYATVMRNTSTCYKDYALHVGSESDMSGEDGVGKGKTAEIEMERMGLLSRAREAGEEAVKWSGEWEELVLSNIKGSVSAEADDEGHKFTEADALDANRDRMGAAFSLAAVLTAQSRALSASKHTGKTKKNVKQKASVAGNILKKAETTCRTAISEMAESEGINHMDLLQEGSDPSLPLANGLNTLGVILSLRGSKHSRDKNDGIRLFHEAEQCYMKAYEARTTRLRKGHEDVVASLFNLAEVADKMGRDDDANKIREFIMEEIRGDQESSEEKARRELQETLEGLDHQGGLGGGGKGEDYDPNEGDDVGGGAPTNFR